MRPASTRLPALVAAAPALAIATLTGIALALPAAATPPDTIATPPGAASERWRVEVTGTAGFNTFPVTNDRATGVAVLPDGSVVASGALRNENELPGGGYRGHYDFVVAKRDGTTGAEIATFVADGGDFRNEVAEAVTGDSQGNTIAAGRLRLDKDGAFNWEFAVVKLDASLVPVWTPHFYLRDGSLAETGARMDNANAVAVDSNDDIFAAGRLYQDGSDGDLALCKIAGSDGAELWCATVDGTETGESGFDEAFAVVVDSNDDVIVIGNLEETPFDIDFYVAKFAGNGDGLSGPLLLWETTIDGIGTGANSDRGFSVAVGPTQGGPDAVYVTGFFENETTLFDIGVARLDGTTGLPDWTRSIDGAGDNRDELGARVLVDPASGDLIVAGSIESGGDTGRDMFLARLDPTTGSSIWQGAANGSAAGALDSGLDVAILTNGDLAMVGSFQNDHDNMSPPANNPDGEPDPSNLDISIVVFDAAGDGGGGILEKWRIDLLGFDNRFPQNITPYHSLDAGTAVAAAPDGDVFVVGQITRPNKSLSADNSRLLISRVPEPGSAASSLAAALAMACLRARRRA